MESKQKHGFEQVMLMALAQAKTESDNKQSVNAILKMLVEIRESAKMNEDYQAYERITDALAEQGIELREEIHVTAHIKED